jgi:N utilization substance protein B
MNRHLSRIIVMQSLYEWDFRQSENAEEIAKRNIDRIGESADSDFILAIVKGVVANMDKIDNSIVKAAPEWPIDQISVVDKTILRLSIFELLYGTEVPPKVAINEAVELGKTFGGENSSKFINGVLGTLYRQSERYNPEEDIVIKDVPSVISVEDIKEISEAKNEELNIPEQKNKED